MARSRARNWVGLARRTSRPLRTWWTFIPLTSLPEQMRTKATRSRWALSMFAWILKTKPENSPPAGSTGPWSDWREPGGGISSQKVSRKASSPKLLTAEPKNIGDSSPARNFSSWNPSPAASSSSASWRSWS